MEFPELPVRLPERLKAGSLFGLAFFHRPSCDAKVLLQGFSDFEEFRRKAPLNAPRLRYRLLAVLEENYPCQFYLENGFVLPVAPGSSGITLHDLNSSIFPLSKTEKSILGTKTSRDEPLPTPGSGA